MSAKHGCNDDKAVVESFKEALIGRVGSDRYQLWFAQGIECDFIVPEPDGESDNSNRGTFVVRIRGQFALDRVRKNFLREIRGAAAQACGATVDVHLCLDEPPAQQVDLPLVIDNVIDDEAGGDGAVRDADAASNRESATVNESVTENEITDSPQANLNTGGPSHTTSKKQASGSTSRQARPQNRRRRSAQPLSDLIVRGAGTSGANHVQSKHRSARRDTAASSKQPSLPNLEPAATDSAYDAASTAPATPSSTSASSFVAGPCNRLAHTAMSMVCQDPSTASPLFLCGPSGSGKTHILSAIAEMLRRRHRMRRVMHLSAEQFTNDFISSVGNSGITAFRRRYRDVDALLIDDVQFLGAKQATLREMLYTVETLSGDSRPLVFSGLQSPTEIPGLSRELAGRMAAGLVCQLQPIDLSTREVILRRWLDQRCQMEVPDHIIDQITPMLAGDGRVISGVANMINTLQRMYSRMPTMDEMRRHGGDLLRAARPVATLSVIESAVCEAFRLPSDALRGGSQTRAVSQPRMLAMYLSRQLTSSAYVEIARHFGGKSHSTAISAEKNVKAWIQRGQAIGRGGAAMSTEEAIDRVEGLLRSG